MAAFVLPKKYNLLGERCESMNSKISNLHPHQHKTVSQKHAGTFKIPDFQFI